jgi:anti-sigma factor (TIGR02949 family)
MANCNETIRELDAFLDGELPDEVRDHIHAHLGSCMDCLQAFDFQAELKAAIRRKCSSDAMPAGLIGRIEQCFNTDFDGDGVVGPT